MNGKKLACIILMIVLAGLVYGTQVMQKTSSARHDEASAAESEFNNARSQREILETELTKLKYDTQDLRQFLTQWEPVIGRIQTAQEAEQTLMSIVRNSGILTLTQKFEIKDSRTNPLIPKSLQGTLTVQDDYAKTLNWLGELERKLPLARITTCRLKQGESGRQINLEIHFEIPLINIQAEIEEPKK